MKQSEIKMYEVGLGEAEIAAVVKVLESGQLAQGMQVAEMERQFASFCHAKYAVAANSGTAALHMALYALGIGAGDEVIVPAFTFVATANTVLMAGAEPVFTDIDPETFNLSPKSVEKMIGPRTKALIGVNLYGQPADWSELKSLAKAYRLKLVEDAAQSVGAVYRQEKSGGLADVGCFSFYATKNLASGEGGMVTTQDKYTADRARLFRHHGQDPSRNYTYRDLGYNYRMMEVQAAILLVQLNKVKENNRRRMQNAKLYSQLLGNVPGIIVPRVADSVESVFHQYTVRVTPTYRLSRKQLQRKLADLGIQCGVYYPKPLYRAHHLARYRREARRLIETEKACQQVLSLPIHPRLTTADIDRVAGVIAKLG